MTTDDYTEDKDLETGAKRAGVYDREKNSFVYYPYNKTEFEGREVDYFRFTKPTLKKLKSHKVSISDNMSSQQIESMLCACILMIVDTDETEFVNLQKKEILGDMYSDDILAMMAECAERFFGVSAD